jgi:hypothetical protein
MPPDEPTRPAVGHPKLRRAGGLLVAVAIGLVAVVGLIVFFNSRDEAGIDHSGDAGPVPGQAAEGPQLGAARDRLLRIGDVIIVFGGSRRPPAALVALQDKLSGPPDPALTAAGQAVLLEPSREVSGIEAHAWRRELRVQDPADPQLEAFASYWLGRGDR